jgi:hypothetical protein
MIFTYTCSYLPYSTSLVGVKWLCLKLGCPKIWRCPWKRSHFGGKMMSRVWTPKPHTISQGAVSFNFHCPTSPGTFTRWSWSSTFPLLENNTPHTYANSAPKRSPATNFFGFGQHRHGFTSGWGETTQFLQCKGALPKPKTLTISVQWRQCAGKISTGRHLYPIFLGGDPVVQREAPSSYSIFWLGVPLQDLRGVTTLSHVANNPTIEKKHDPLVGYQTGACFTIRVSTASFGWYPFFLHGPLADIGTPLHIHFTNGTIW